MSQVKSKVEQHSSQEGDNGLVTPSTIDSSSEKIENVSNKDNNNNIINVDDSDDSWSVIYSSDESNSSNDFESKLTESSHEDNTENDPEDSNMSIATVNPKGADDGAASVNTLRRDSNEQWNGSLSIPKLSIKDESDVKNTEETIKEEDKCTSLLDDLKLFASKVTGTVKNCSTVVDGYWKEFLTFVDTNTDGTLTKASNVASREVSWFKNVPYLEQVTLKQLLLVVILLGLTINQLYGANPPNVSFLEQNSPSYNDYSIAPDANYLMCETSRSLAVIERNPASFSIERVYFYGSNLKDTPVNYYKKIMGFERLKPSNDEMISFMNGFCGEKIRSVIGGHHKYFYLSGKNDFAPVKLARQIMINAPDVSVKSIEKFTGTNKFVVVEGRTCLWEPLDQFKSLINQKLETESISALKQKTLDIFGTAQQAMSPLWEQISNEALKFDKPFFQNLQKTVSQRGLKFLEIVSTSSEGFKKISITATGKANLILKDLIIGLKAKTGDFKLEFDEYMQTRGIPALIKGQESLYKISIKSLKHLRHFASKTSLQLKKNSNQLISIVQHVSFKLQKFVKTDGERYLNNTAVLSYKLFDKLRQRITQFVSDN